MSAGARWPDFRLASTLRSLVGSQTRAEAPEAQAAGTDEIEARDQPSELENRTTGPDGLGTRQTDDRPELMADPQERRLDDLDGFESFDDDVAAADADFGALEMFDSNAPQAPYPSQLDASALQAAPEAVMDDLPPPSTQSKKSKRDKKNKKKRRSSQPAAHDQQNDDVSGSAAQKVENGAKYPNAGVAHSDDRAAPPSTQSKKKRKLSDNADGKRRKKRRSHEQEAVESAHAGDFLRKSKGRGAAPETAIYEEDAEDANVGNSPSAARLRRRSQSREARSRENSAPLATARDPMDVDDQGANEHGGKALVLEAPSIESLAREAWNEHLNSGANQAVDSNEQEIPDDDDAQDAPQNSESVYDLPVNPSREPEPTPRRTRSTRKKAKPTFYEQPPELEQDEEAEARRDAMGELPSPSAITPKPSRRAKKASKGPRPKPPKLSQSMRGGSEEADEEMPRRRNKMAGYTQGRFTEEELARIRKAVESFRAQNDLTQQQVNEMIQAPGGTTAGDEHAQLWARILAECPDRHRQKVINVARKKFHNFVARGTWTGEQDAELSGLIQQHGTKWSFIAGLINRHPEDVRDRYRNYVVCGDAQRKDSWDEEEEKRLAQHVIEAMEAIDEMRKMHPSRELLKKSYEELIDWQDISEKMDRTRSRLQCITKWKWLNIKTHGKDKLASSQPDSNISFRLETARRQIADMPEEEQFRLLLAIQGTGVGVEEKIPWQRLLDKRFRGQWHRTTQVLLWHRMKQAVPDFESKKVRDCVQYLVDEYNRTAELPDVVKGVYDDSAEMALISTVPTGGAISTPAPSKMSQEFVGDSDAEDGGAAGQNGTDDAGDAAGGDATMEDIQIDPALTEEPEAAKKATPAKKTPTKKRGSSAKKNGRTAPAPTQDTIQDDEEEEAAPEEDAAAQQQDDDSEIDVEQFRRKKTPSKFKSPSARKSRAAAESRDALSDSGMEDMDDLPARVQA